jgi:lysophospholipase L1-like esterase
MWEVPPHMRILPRAAALSVALSLLAAAPALAERYVALGDSYSSGVGTRTYTDATCKRSAYAYPALLAQQRPDTQLTSVACSGATTATVTSTQLSSLTSTTGLVTITVGGNDAGFTDVVTACAKPDGSTCAQRTASTQSFVRGTLPGRLDALYTQIRQRSPSARVVVLGYPRLFAGIDCNAGTFFSREDMTNLNATADVLRDVEQARAAAHGFTFVDVIGRFTGHAVCQDEWLNGLSNPVAESYHPNRTGQANGYLPALRAVVG